MNVQVNGQDDKMKWREVVRFMKNNPKVMLELLPESKRENLETESKLTQTLNQGDNQQKFKSTKSSLFQRYKNKKPRTRSVSRSPGKDLRMEAKLRQKDIVATSESSRAQPLLGGKRKSILSNKRRVGPVSESQALPPSQSAQAMDTDASLKYEKLSNKVLGQKFSQATFAKSRIWRPASRLLSRENFQKTKQAYNNQKLLDFLS